jgi:thioredoxin 1
MPAAHQLIPLPNHEMFEAMYADTKEATLIYFTADWCGACKRVDWEFLLEEFPELKIYRCDVDANKYTPGFCGVRSIPSFVMLLPGSKQATPVFQSSDTAKIATWIMTSLRSVKK